MSKLSASAVFNRVFAIVLGDFQSCVLVLCTPFYFSHFRTHADHIPVSMLLSVCTIYAYVSGAALSRVKKVYL